MGTVHSASVSFMWTVTESDGEEHTLAIMTDLTDLLTWNCKLVMSVHVVMIKLIKKKSRLVSLAKCSPRPKGYLTETLKRILSTYAPSTCSGGVTEF